MLSKIFTVILAIVPWLLFCRLFENDATSLVVIGAAAVAAILWSVVDHLHVHLGVRIAVSLTAYVLGACVTLLWSETFFGLPTVNALRDLWTAVTIGGRSLFDLAPPLSGRVGDVAVLAGLAWLGGTSVVLVGSRFRAPVAPVVPALCWLLIGVLVTAPATANPALVAVLFVAVALLSCTTRVRTVSTGGTVAARTGRTQLAVAAFAASVLGGISLVPYGAWTTTARSFRDPNRRPPDELFALSPLATYQAIIRQQPATVLFTVSGRSSEPVRVATLDQYDGVVWSPAGRFVAAVRAPREHGSSEHTIQLAAWDLPWLPTVGATAAPPKDVLERSYTGDLLRPASNVALSAYVVGAGVGPPDADTLQSGSRAAGLEFATFRQLPDLAVDSDALDAIAIRLAPRTDNTDLTQLRNLEGSLRDGHAYRADAPSGQSLARIFAFLVSDPASTDAAGTAEQFASAFAILARSLGYPSRVVIGVAPTSLRYTSDIAEVSSDQLDVWPEVALANIGWVRFDPTPPRTQAVPPKAQVFAPAAVGASASNVAPVDTKDLEPAQSAGGSAWRHARVIVGFPLLVLIVGGLAWIVAAKRFRRRTRRRAGAPSDRVVGAWHEAQDRLVEAGVHRRPWLSPTQLAAHTASSLGHESPQLFDIAMLVDRAIYSDAGADERDAIAAWTLLSSFERGLRYQQGWFRTQFRHFDPRSLFRPSPRGSARAVPVRAKVRAA